LINKACKAIQRIINTAPRSHFLLLRRATPKMRNNTRTQNRKKKMPLKPATGLRMPCMIRKRMKATAINPKISGCGRGCDLVIVVVFVHVNII
jgi:hypothetical protein